MLRSPLKRDKDNPYTYYCKRCGQEFNTYGYIGCSNCDHLEPMGEIKNPKCRCMKLFGKYTEGDLDE